MYTEMIFMREKKESKAKNTGTESRIEIPEGTGVEIEGETIRVKGKLGENSRAFNGALLSISKSGNNVLIKATEERSLRKKAGMLVNTLSKEISNDIKGVNDYFEIRMETVFLHFPITLEAKGGTFTIKNIFGERKPREARIVGSAKAEIKDKNVRIYGTNLDDVSQTAANIRQACRINNKDVRVFQDGLYISVE